MPAVSVVIPVYNRAHLVGTAVRSILNQTFSDLEVVVVDDGSTDDLESVLNSFEDARVRLIRHSKNMGGTAARNTGIQNATAKLVAFLDSDDEWVEDKLARQMAALERTESKGRPLAVMCRARRDYHPEPTSYDDEWHIQPGQEIKQVLMGAAKIRVKVQWVSALVPREDLVAINGFDPALPATQWWDLVYRLADRCDFLLGVDQLMVLHDPKGQRVQSTSNVGQAAEILLSKYEEDIAAPDARVMRSHLLTFASIHRMSKGEYLSPIATLYEAFRAMPNGRTGLRLMGSLLGGKVFFKAQTLFGRNTTGGRNRV